MGLHINSDEADRLARELAAETGESLATAVTVALAERLSRVRRPANSGRREALEAIRRRFAARPVLDDRKPDDIIGYNGSGTFD
ncbi:type II toxin-antitoxin system VapB family antitoxin [Azospirillum rugosum]|uniref:Antitoxin VapB n=1 Tax=Azospirillum rugosum TaxID=416170 RepID=A0ABS4SF29_9PROT|nr:type II toxin-antitoxin system VapB family antitoxin [Azospirillum rugosum]MBP2291182.1 antitoxin VapB [Azospirillum rugosum]MDQ0524754.1 antitoxin VapB [Azospirillum rugosum]